MGAARPRRRFSRVPRSLKPAPRNGPSSRSAIHWCQAASTCATVSAEPCRASSRPEKIAYSVSSVPAGSRSRSPDAAPAGADLRGPHVLGGRAERVPDGQTRAGRRGPARGARRRPRAPGPRECRRSMPYAASPRRAGLPLGAAEPFADAVPPRAVEPSLRAPQRHPVDIWASTPTDERFRTVNVQVSTSLPCWREPIFVRTFEVVENGERPSVRFRKSRESCGHHRDRGRAARGAPRQPHPPGCQRWRLRPPFSERWTASSPTSP